MDGFTFINGTIDGSNDEGSILANESNISFNPEASVSVPAGTERSLSGVVNISNNVLTDALFHGIGLRKQGTDPAVHVFGIEGLSPSPNTLGSQVINHANSLNPLSANGTILISAETGFTSVVVP